MPHPVRMYEDAEIVIDAHHTAYALQNLVENAINASAAGGGVSIAGAVLPSGDYEIRIIDSGAGMSEAQIRTALTPFAQTDGGLARYREGLGLGLPIASRLLFEQGSTLTLQSKVGEGTIVSVRFLKQTGGVAADAA